MTNKMVSIYFSEKSRKNNIIKYNAILKSIIPINQHIFTTYYGVIVLQH